MLPIGRALILVCLLLAASPLVLVLWLWPASHVVELDVDGSRRLVSSIFAGALLFAALVAIRVSSTIVGPLEALNRSAQRLAKGELDATVPTPGRFTSRELRTLTASFNEMAASLTRSRRDADESNAARSEFVRTVTHELRSPVNAIIGFSELLASRGASQFTTEVRDCYVRDINAMARHLLALVNDLLDLARAEAGQYELVEHEFGLDEIIQRAARYIDVQVGERQTQVRFAFECEPPGILGDERALFQVLLNLMSNAVSYGRPGGVMTIGCQLTHDGGCEISVRDDGPGIAPKDLDRVLLPFQRAQTAANEAVTGSGLGLPIVKRFVELHGGTFTLWSALGIGTSARVLLPPSRVRQHGSEAAEAA